MVERAEQLHEDAAARCFIASSVNFPVRHEPQTVVTGCGRRPSRPWHGPRYRHGLR